MKKIIVILLLISIYADAGAQDKIYITPRQIGKPTPPHIHRGGTPVNRPMESVIHAKVTEITEALIKYKRDDNPDGPLYSIRATIVDSIVFSSGVVQKFSRHRVVPEYKIRERQEFQALPPNIIGGGVGMFVHRIRIFDSGNDPDFTPYAKLYLNYERMFVNDYLGVEISPFIALNKKSYGASLHAKFYPKNKGRFRIGFGPIYTLYVRNMTDKYWHPEGYAVERTYETTLSNLGFGALLQSHLTRNIFVGYNISASGMIGNSNKIANPYGTNWNSYENQGQLEMRLGLGYRF